MLFTSSAALQLNGIWYLADLWQAMVHFLFDRPTGRLLCLVQFQSWIAMLDHFWYVAEFYGLS